MSEAATIYSDKAVSSLMLNRAVVEGKGHSGHGFYIAFSDHLGAELVRFGRFSDRDAAERTTVTFILEPKP